MLNRNPDILARDKEFDIICYRTHSYPGGLYNAVIKTQVREVWLCGSGSSLGVGPQACLQASFHGVI